MKATERKIELLDRICFRRKDNVDNLAFEFGVSNSTIRKDIQELSCNYPIYTVQGNGGGVYVVEGYYIGRKYLKSDQQELLCKLKETLQGSDLIVMEKILETFALSNNGKGSRK